MVYDVTNSSTFTHLSYWMNSINCVRTTGNRSFFFSFLRTSSFFTFSLLYLFSSSVQHHFLSPLFIHSVHLSSVYNYSEWRQEDYIIFHSGFYSIGYFGHKFVLKGVNPKLSRSQLPSLSIYLSICLFEIKGN